MLLRHFLHRRNDSFRDRSRLLPVGVPLLRGSVFPEEFVDSHRLLEVLGRGEMTDEEGRMPHDFSSVSGVVAVAPDVFRRLHSAIHVAAVHAIEGDLGEVHVGAGSELLEAEGRVGVARLLTVAHQEDGDGANGVHWVTSDDVGFVFGVLGEFPTSPRPRRIA